MAKSETARTVRFPDALWAAIDRDAVRCRRSSVKQMEAVLMAVYDLESIEIDPAGIKRGASETVITGRGKDKIRMVDTQTVPIVGDKKR